MCLEAAKLSSNSNTVLFQESCTNLCMHPKCAWASLSPGAWWDSVSSCSTQPHDENPRLPSEQHRTAVDQRYVWMNGLGKQDSVDKKIVNHAYQQALLQWQVEISFEVSRHNYVLCTSINKH